VHRLTYSGDVAAGQLAVFQGASEAPIPPHFDSCLDGYSADQRKNGAGRVERATRKNSQLTAARRVALKMGRLRIDLDMRPPRALPTAHFERNDVIIICQTVH
jgi:hypothetical protein